MSVRIGFQLPATLCLNTLAGAVAAALLATPAYAILDSKAVQSKATQAVSSVRSSPALSAMGAGESLTIRNAMVTPQGRTVAHTEQTYNGHRVWGSSVIVHADPRGGAHVAAQTQLATVAPAGTPVLSQKQATDIALKALALKGPAIKAKAELVVFPTQFRGGIAWVFNKTTNKYEIDRANSAMPGQAKDAYVWAYEVKAFARNAQDGLKDMTYVVDARNGAILKVMNELRGLGAPNPPAQVATDVPVKGVGHSQYSGDVTIDTTQRADGTFAMIDRTRGTSYIPFFHDYYTDFVTGAPILDELGNPISVVGLQAIAEGHEGYGFFELQTNWFWLDKNPTNEWGDGQPFNGYPFGTETAVNGQTAAVDAHFGLATTWDFFKNIFGRDGLDNQGTSVVTIVHAFNFFGFPDEFAFWSKNLSGVFLGDGTSSPRTNPRDGQLIPGDPNGHGAMTSPDIVGHELTHGVIDSSAGLVNYGAAGAISESTADFFSVLIKAYAKRSNPNDSNIPQTGLVWSLGEMNGPAPYRDMQKPSTVGYGRDNWYHGVEYTNLYYQAGVMNRCFYFLSEGASSTVGAKTYSPYLRGGMTGIGADQAARIWYKALTEYLTPNATFEDARTAALSAATDIYGDPSPQVSAVRNAFAAVNLGGAIAGQDPVRIDFALVHPDGTAFNYSGNDAGVGRIPFVSMLTPSLLKAEVLNTTDKRVTWSLGAILGSLSNPGFQSEGGKIDAAGFWTPDTNFGFHAITVTSVADPLQYAEGTAFVINGDADSDLEFDAIDLGGVALSWGLDGVAKWSHAILGSSYADSFDVAAIVEAFINAYGGV